ncbi:MAG: hypothetical protein FJW88_04305 [Actinobacteria bacterium]|nr:hypothetical protein [Actinomycetota bacterium]
MTPLRVLAPRGLVDQVLVNLLLNFRAAMPDGGTVEITMSVTTVESEAKGELEPGRYLAFGVADSGPGMPVEVAEHAFEPFFSTRAGSHGTGLGFSTA